MTRRLIGGLVVAVVIALAMTQTAQAFYIECPWWFILECYF